jgi:hypothetical protein
MGSNTSDEGTTPEHSPLPRRSQVRLCKLQVSAAQTGAASAQCSRGDSGGSRGGGGGNDASQQRQRRRWQHTRAHRAATAMQHNQDWSELRLRSEDIRHVGRHLKPTFNLKLVVELAGGTGLGRTLCRRGSTGTVCIPKV